jgi:SAM-dependent methyltransferase
MAPEATDKISIPNSLKELLGDKEYYRYLKLSVYPELERLAMTEKLDNVEIRKIAENVKNIGVNILSPTAYFHTNLSRNNYSDDGWIVQTRHEILPFLLNHVIVKSSDSEDFSRRVKSHKSLEAVLKGSKFEDKIPKNFYASKKHKITDTPVIGEELFVYSLQNANPYQKEELLKSFIDQYVDFNKFLNRPEVKSGLDFGKLSDFGRFFGEKFGAVPLGKLDSLYKQDFASDLNAACSTVIHADLSPANILKGTSDVPKKDMNIFGHIDWGHGVSNGFIEYDFGTLFKKSRIDMDLEEKLVKYAASKAYSSESEREKSFTIYTKNQITQQLLDAQRYLKRSEEKQNQKISSKLLNMANLNFNNALQRTRRAVKSGIVSREFYDALIKEGVLKRFTVLNDGDISALADEYNPNLCVSQENLIESDIHVSDKYDVQKNLKTIDNPLPELKKTFELELELLRMYAFDCPEGSNIIELGCGAGRPLIDLAHAVPGRNYFGLDNDSECIEEARNRSMKTSGFPRQKPSFTNWDVLRKVFPIDNMLTYSTYNLIGSILEEDQDILIRVKCHSTKRGGHIITASWNTDDQTKEFLEAYYPHIGLRILDMDNKKTVTDAGTFYRVHPDQIAELYERNGIKPIGLHHLGVFEALVGRRD